MIASTPTGVPANRSHMTATSSMIGYAFVLVYFFQLVPSVYPRLMISQWWWDRVIQFSASLFHLYSAAVAVGPGFCLAELNDGPSTISEQRYLFTMAMYWSQLAFIIVLFGFLSALFLLSRSPFTEQNVKMLVTYFLPAFLLFQLFSNLPLLRANLQSVHCVSFNNSLVMYSDAATTCYTSWQVFSVFYVLVCIAPLCLVIDTAAFLLSRGRISVPAYLLLCIFPLVGLLVVPFVDQRARTSRAESQRDEFEVDETTPPGLRSVSAHSIVTIQSVLIKPFSSYLHSGVVDIGWMTIILVRNCVICMISSLLQHDPASRSILVTILCFFFTLDQLVCRSYSHPAVNRLDTSLWILLTLLSTLDIYSSVIYEAGTAQSIWSVVDWFARLLASLPIFLIVIVIVFLLVRIVLRRAGRCRNIRPF